MQILFDLMVMGFKYQVLQTVQPEDIYFITKKHLTTVKSFVSGSFTENFVQVAEEKFDKMCAEFNAYDFQVVRQ